MHQIFDILGGRYEVFGYREGGMGVVYFVTDLTTGRKFAAKTFKPDLRGAEELERRFRAELEFSLYLGEHPNVLTIHFIENFDGRPYLFTDYIADGQKSSGLAGRIHDGEIDLRAAVSFAHQIAKGMEFLNSRGAVAHLDLKPGNILVTAEDVVKVSDFGLARNVEPLRFHPATENAGSWPYMSPEQFNGEAVDTRSDIYSFGIIFYEMLAGRYPFPFDLAGRTKEEQFALFKQFHTSHDLGERFYWGGLPDAPGLDVVKRSAGPLGDPWGEHSNDLGILIGGCINRSPYDRFYNFTRVREALEFAFGSYLGPAASAGAGAGRDEFQRGLDLQKIGRHSKALQHFNRAMRQAPERAEMLLAAAASLWELDLRDDAVSFVARAARMEPENPVFRDTLSDYRKRLKGG